MDWFTLGPEVLGVLFLVALLAGFIDSIAGGGGLLTIPALLAVGVPPTQALATNKLQSVGGSFSASLYFIRRGAVNLKDQRLTIALTLAGSMLGAILVQHMQADILRQILPLLVIGIGVYFLLTPRLGELDRQRRLSALPFALIAGGGIGFYDGFFGPGAGSFYALAFVTLCGFNLAKSTAHAKVLNFTSNLGGLTFFILGGKVLWGIGLVMLVGQVLGARLGAHMVLTRGQKLIRPMIVVVSLVMSCKLLYDNHGSEIQAWLALQGIG
ncbi:sulfite exporter TauE/SafE family protein [Yersinia nurmii]|uniref:Probable membrane transporter protein n=1 Tax=Yersinia nurmii TaxID=685706 RepID=A0AAW7JWZ3_9GAMM|nr:sulfite exporter TauE/SafE family protein [Yersinia nurmii]MDN0087154.1 sulfite exporter TauE/SafE family protein [Yersinia nurmii]CNE10864.1 membrane protein [Yersinia nurmii]